MIPGCMHVYEYFAVPGLYEETVCFTVIIDQRISASVLVPLQAAN